MGVPKFYRFISERYPLINTKIENDNVPEMDNLYLDMNGIVHNCVRGDGSKNSEDGERYQNLLHVTRTHEDMLLDVFKYIDNLFSMIRPRKLLYFAIDGVAPRAKMNQQRSRRFRSAKERTDEHQRRLAEDPMYVAAESTPFDSNCISPGTEFMQKLTDALEYYVADRVTHNPQWADIEVVLSGAEAPGEGEHKIMEYIRAVKVAGKMPPNTRHCLYGLDADLIMLGLVSHEPHFFLLREKVDFSAYWKRKGGPRMATQLDTITFGEFELLSIGLLREYLALDIGAEGNSLLPYFDVERIVDDFVFMLMLVGNDFLPHLPTIEIADGMVVAMMHLYRRLLPRMEGYLFESGRICPHRVELFVAKLALFEPRAMKRKERELRSRGPRGHNGPKTLFSDSEELDAIFGFSESSGIGAPVHNYDVESEIAKCRSITHSKKQTTNKRKYYAEKFGPEFAKDEDASISELSTHYMQGVVWTLKYYFEGCQSWRWYYPYHYAPFPSDLTGIAEKADPSTLTFSSDKPFLPLQQLMSVLPPASAHCIPMPYRKLMTSPASPIRDFYVEDFKIDMNGKRNEWEAVVLLPFVDADRLFAAIATVPATELTAAEKRRNTLGVSMVFRRDRKNFSKEVKSPFPHRLRTFTSCAKGTPLSLPVIPKGTPFPATWVIGTHAPGSASWVSDLPTLHPVPHAGKLEKLSVNLFGFPSRSESLAITLGSWEIKSRDFIFFDGVEEPQTTTSVSSPPALVGNGSIAQSGYKVPENVGEAHAMGIGVGCQVWTHYPWRVAGIVEAVMDEAICVRLDTMRLGLHPPLVSKTNSNTFTDSANRIAASLMEKGGVDIDQPKVLVEVNPLPSTKRSLFGSPASESTPLLFSAVTVLTAAMACKEPGTENAVSLSHQVPLSVGQTSLFVGRGPFFGNLCQVKELLDDGMARVQYSVSQACAREPSFGYGIVERWQSQRWKSLSQVATKCSMAVSVANTFFGSVRVRLENGKDEIDLGLGIKYSSRGLLIPGYAKVNDYGTFFFSEKASALLAAYKEAFPELFAAVHKFMSANRGSKGAPVYEPRQLFPNASESESAVMAIGSWISASEVASLPLVSSGSLILPRDAVLELERSASVANTLQAELAKSVLNGNQSGTASIVSQRQLRTGCESLDWQSDRHMQNSQCLDPVSPDGRTLRLGDRVANRIAYTGTPFGLRGSVIGIHRDSNGGQSRDPSSSVGGDKRRHRKSDPEQPSSSSSCTVEVVFDEEFIGGGDLNGLCTPGKGKAVPASSLYSIRPDRENKYYSSNYARVAKALIPKHAAATNGSSAAHAKRGKAIAAAAVESFKKASKPRVKKSGGQAKGVDLRKEGQEPKDNEGLHVPPDPLTMPIPSFAKSRPRASPSKKPLTAQNSGNEKTEARAEEQPLTDSGDDVAALTARIKAALGVVSEPEEVGSVRNLSGTAVEGPLPVVESHANGHVGTSSGLSQVEKSPTRRKPRHRNRKQNPTKTATPVSNERSSKSGNNTSANDGFASVWNQLKSRSNDQ